MTKNPYLNALIAGLYIVCIVFVIGQFVDGQKEETLLIPMTMLSLLVLSVIVMWANFFFHPATMFLSGQKQEAVTFFLKTLGTFAIFAIILVTILSIFG